MANSELVKDITKDIKNTTIRQELPPGTPRRYEPDMGVGKHNKRIHKESRYTDTYKNMPFSFRKPPKPIGKSVAVKCDNCGDIKYGTTATVGIICNACGKFSSVTEV